MKFKRIFLFMITLILLSISSKLTLADGLIVIPPPPNSNLPVTSSFLLEVKYHRVEVRISGQTALTTVSQEFYNPTGQRLEGNYLFPVPKGAAIKKFSMVIDGKEVAAELVEAGKARRIYEDIVRKQLDPALLEYSGQDLIKARIFPIEPHASKKVNITYQEVLDRNNGAFEYVYPLNTEKFSAKNLQEVSIKVEIQAEDNLKNIYCPTHEAEVIRKGERNALVSYEARDLKPDTDFKLYYNTDRSKFGLSVAAYRQAEADGYFFLNVSPGFEIGANEIDAKDIIFVLDNSGSMAGEKMEQARKALLFCINNLNKTDRFEIIRFSTEAEALFNKPVEASGKNLQKAKDFIGNIKAIGGTDIDGALDLALSEENDRSRPRMVVFMTDGKPTIGELDEDKLLAKLKTKNTTNIRIFTFGIGFEINTHLLDKITEMTRAYRTYISPKEDIEVKISDFYTKVQAPVLTDLKLKFGDNVKVMNVYPQDLPDLFKGSTLTILGRFQGDGRTKVVLSGKVRNKPQVFEYEVDFPKMNPRNDFIPPLWAARRVGYLLDKVRLYGESREMLDEITSLAREYGIITPYTSYLIVEDEANRVSNQQLRVEDQTLNNIPGTADVFAKSKKEYGEMSSPSGEPGVQASKEFQALNNASGSGDTRQGQSRLDFQDQNGQNRNLTQSVKNVQGRAIYNVGNSWVDSRIQSHKNPKQVRIKFGSKEYFDLLQAAPESAEFLALGRNVRFVLKGMVYEVYEK